MKSIVYKGQKYVLASSNKDAEASLEVAVHNLEEAIETMKTVAITLDDARLEVWANRVEPLKEDLKEYLEKMKSQF